METREPRPPVNDKEAIQIPEWDNAAAGDSKKHAANAARPRKSIRSRFDTAMPPHRKYLRMSRKVFLLVVLAVLLALLALIIGLAVGLTQQSKYVRLLAASAARSH